MTVLWVYHIKRRSTHVVVRSGSTENLLYRGWGSVGGGGEGARTLRVMLEDYRGDRVGLSATHTWKVRDGGRIKRLGLVSIVVLMLR